MSSCINQAKLQANADSLRNVFFFAGQSVNIAVRQFIDCVTVDMFHAPESPTSASPLYGAVPLAYHYATGLTGPSTLLPTPDSSRNRDSRLSHRGFESKTGIPPGFLPSTPLLWLPLTWRWRSRVGRGIWSCMPFYRKTSSHRPSSSLSS
jgi:hypothetical protein